MKKTQRFSNQLRRAVEASELTCYRISKITGIDQGNLSRFVHQGTGVSMANADKLCELLGLRLVSKNDVVRKRPAKKHK